MKRKSLLAVFGVFLAATVLSNVPVQAQQNGASNGFLVSPVREELTVEPGKSATTELTVENVTGASTTASAVVNDFEPSADESGQPKILLDNSKSSSGNSFKSIVAPIAPIKLGPKEKKTVPVRITVPMGASAGGYYGAIRFATESSGTDKNVALTASVATIFLVTVPGDLKEGMELVEFSAAKDENNGRFFVGSGAMSLVTRLQNTGNIHLKPFGRVQVTDRSGNVVEKYEFNSTEPRANILPGSTRKFEDKLTKGYSFGKYTATANLGYENGGGSLITASTTFWIIPIWFLAVAAVLIVALIAGAFLVFLKLSRPSKHKVKTRR